MVTSEVSSRDGRNPLGEAEEQKNAGLEEYMPSVGEVASRVQGACTLPGLRGVGEVVSGGQGTLLLPGQREGGWEGGGGREDGGSNGGRRWEQGDEELGGAGCGVEHPSDPKEDRGGQNPEGEEYPGQEEELPCRGYVGAAVRAMQLVDSARGPVTRIFPSWRKKKKGGKGEAQLPPPERASEPPPRKERESEDASGSLAGCNDGGREGHDREEDTDDEVDDLAPPPPPRVEGREPPVILPSVDEADLVGEPSANTYLEKPGPTLERMWMWAAGKGLSMDPKAATATGVIGAVGGASPAHPKLVGADSKNEQDYVWGLLGAVAEPPLHLLNSRVPSTEEACCAKEVREQKRDVISSKDTRDGTRMEVRRTSGEGKETTVTSRVINSGTSQKDDKQGSARARAATVVNAPGLSMRRLKGMMYASTANRFWGVLLAQEALRNRSKMVAGWVQHDRDLGCSEAKARWRANRMLKLLQVWALQDSNDMADRRANTAGENLATLKGLDVAKALEEVDGEGTEDKQMVSFVEGVCSAPCVVPLFAKKSCLVCIAQILQGHDPKDVAGEWGAYRKGEALWKLTGQPLVAGLVARHNREMHATNGNINYTAHSDNRADTVAELCGYSFDVVNDTTEGQRSQQAQINDCDKRIDIIYGNTRDSANFRIPGKKGTVHQVLLAGEPTLRRRPLLAEAQPLARGERRAGDAEGRRNFVDAALARGNIGVGRMTRVPAVATMARGLDDWEYIALAAGAPAARRPWADITPGVDIVRRRRNPSNRGGDGGNVSGNEEGADAAGGQGTQAEEAEQPVLQDGTINWDKYYGPGFDEDATIPRPIRVGNVVALGPMWVGVGEKIEWADGVLTPSTRAENTVVWLSDMEARSGAVNEGRGTLTWSWLAQTPALAAMAVRGSGAEPISLSPITLRIALMDMSREINLTQPLGVSWACAQAQAPQRMWVPMLPEEGFAATCISTRVLSTAAEAGYLRVQDAGVEEQWQFSSPEVAVIVLDVSSPDVNVWWALWTLAHLEYPLHALYESFAVREAGELDGWTLTRRTNTLVSIRNEVSKIIFVPSDQRSNNVDLWGEIYEVRRMPGARGDVNYVPAVIHNANDDIERALELILNYSHSLRALTSSAMTGKVSGAIDWEEMAVITAALTVRWTRPCEVGEEPMEKVADADGAYPQGVPSNGPVVVTGTGVGCTPANNGHIRLVPIARSAVYYHEDAVSTFDCAFTARNIADNCPHLYTGVWNNFSEIAVMLGLAFYTRAAQAGSDARKLGLHSTLDRAGFLRRATEEWKRGVGVGDELVAPAAFENVEEAWVQRRWHGGTGAVPGSSLREMVGGVLGDGSSFPPGNWSWEVNRHCVLRPTFTGLRTHPGLWNAPQSIDPMLQLPDCSSRWAGGYGYFSSNYTWRAGMYGSTLGAVCDNVVMEKDMMRINWWQAPRQAVWCEFPQKTQGGGTSYVFEDTTFLSAWQEAGWRSQFAQGRLDVKVGWGVRARYRAWWNSSYNTLDISAHIMSVMEGNLDVRARWCGGEGKVTYYRAADVPLISTEEGIGAIRPVFRVAASRTGVGGTRPAEDPPTSDGPTKDTGSSKDPPVGTTPQSAPSATPPVSQVATPVPQEVVLPQRASTVPKPGATVEEAANNRDYRKPEEASV
ncbi:MAG: hypothetical protein FTV3_gp1 [Fushun totivirus 3]|nr:MAG: hypothetical protein FTV3_gp1 [Fushun totivirus 3]